MSFSGIKRQSITVGIPLPAYENLQKLSREKGMTVPGYVKNLIAQHLYDKGLPQYFRPGEPKL